MSLLVSTSLFPPKGWLYREKIAGRYWTNPDPLAPAEECVRRLYNARINNKVKTTLEDCWEALALFTCKRLDNDTRWCQGEENSASTTKTKRSGGGCGGCGQRRKK